MIAYCSPQHRVSRFESVEHRTLIHRSLNLEFEFPIDAGKRTQMRWSTTRIMAAFGLNRKDCW